MSKQWQNSSVLLPLTFIFQSVHLCVSNDWSSWQQNIVTSHFSPEGWWSSEWVLTGVSSRWRSAPLTASSSESPEHGDGHTLNIHVKWFMMSCNSCSFYLQQSFNQNFVFVKKCLVRCVDPCTHKHTNTVNTHAHTNTQILRTPSHTHLCTTIFVRTLNDIIHSHNLNHPNLMTNPDSNPKHNSNPKI